MAGFQGPIVEKEDKPNIDGIAVDDQNNDVRVIVTLKQDVTDENIDKLQKKVGKFKVTSKRWDKIYPKGFAATVSKKQLLELSQDPLVGGINIDEKVTIQLDTATYWSGVTKARSPSPTGFDVTGDRDGSQYDYSNTDVVIAIIDTGIDPMHKDLTGTDNGGTNKIIGWADVVNGQLSPYDDHGHGTHVASITAGEGDEDPRYTGVAPGAALVGVKVLTGGGWGYISWVIDGANWVVANKDIYNIKIMSLSLGTWGSSDGTDPMSVALNNAVNQGITVVVAAGNSGPEKYTISSPAATSSAITVGAIADVGYLLKALPTSSKSGISSVSDNTKENTDNMLATDSKPPTRPPYKKINVSGGVLNLEDNGFYLAPFSSRGPTADNKIKPDVVAPGVYIMADQAVYPVTSEPHGGYIEYSGTSMATPFVSGIVALMLDANYGLTPSGIKNIIRSTAEDYGVTGCDIDYGCGRVRAYRAVSTAATGSYVSGDQWVPTHYRSSTYMNDTTWSKLQSMYVTDPNYPIASTLIMKDYSGYSSGVNLNIFATDPLNNYIGGSYDWGRQDNLILEANYKGYHNITTYKYYPGSGYYTLDISKR